MHTTDIRKPKGEMIQPTKHIQINPEFSGNWTVAGDITGDGNLNFVSVRNDDQAVTAVGAYNLDGDLVWTWGKAGAGGAKLFYDVPCQVYDLYHNGRCEVILSDEGTLKILEGMTGELLESFALPNGLRTADCITFANLQGTDYPTDIIIKDRYHKVWAYNKDWEPLWDWAPQGGIKTCHHPTLMDIDGDGKDEVLAGHYMLDHDGTPMWKIQSRKARKRGHLDCVRVMKKGSKAKEWRIVFTYCGAKYLAMMDGTGKILWKHSNHHFESVDVGYFSKESKERNEPDLYVDIDHRPFGKAENRAYDFNGKRIFTQFLNYGRQHRLIDWNGDGVDEILISNNQSLCNCRGERIGSFVFPDSTGKIFFPQTQMNHDIHSAIIDYSKRGTGDIMMFASQDIAIYENPALNAEPRKDIESKNFTFY